MFCTLQFYSLAFHEVLDIFRKKLYFCSDFLIHQFIYKMKKITLLFTALLMITMAVAAPVSKENATLVCKNFLTYKSANGTAIPGEMKFYKTEYFNQMPVYHVFTIGNSGFVVVSASDRFEPIVAYSFESFYTSNPSFDFAMDAYAHWIFDCESKDKDFRSNVPERWQYWAAPDFSPKPTRAVVVEPLVTSKWNQMRFFDTYCPYDENWRARCVTGCVATAMSQVMNYYSHPLRGKSGTSYVPGIYDRITIYFRDQTYNFNAMPNSPTNYANEMAKLLYHCGVSVQMGYTPSGSGANSVEAVDALKSFFKYDASAWLCPRALFDMDSIQQWHNVLKSELDLRRPLYYSANDGQGGHAFVVDGYDDQNLFHVNWGWGGASDGYFTISDNNPSDMNGYIYDADIIRSCFPGQEAPTPCTGFTRIDASTGRFNSGLPTANYSPNSDCSWLLAAPEASKYVLHFDRLNTEAGADFVNIYNGPTEQSGLALQIAGNNIPPDVTVIADSVLVTFTSDAQNEYSGFQISFTAQTATPYCSNSVNITTDGVTVIEDGSGDAPYRNNTVCEWNITTPDMHHFYLSFTDLELGRGDYVEVYNSTSNPPKLYKRFDVNNWPSPVETCNFGKGRILFVADNWDVDGGFRMTCQTVTSVNDYAGLSNLNIYPNPANDLLNVEFVKDQAGDIRCQLVDMNGKMLMNQSYPHEGGLFSKSINVSNYATGIYFLRIQTAEGTTVEKVIVE